RGRPATLALVHLSRPITDAKNRFIHRLIGDPKMRRAMILFVGTLVFSATFAGAQQPPNIPQLLKSLMGDDPQAIVQALDSLPDLGPEAKFAVPALIKLLESDQAPVRHMAARALGGIGESASRAVPILTKQLADGDASSKVHAAHALGKIGEPGKSATPALLKAVTHEDPVVRRSAIMALSRVKADPNTILSAMTKLLADADPIVAVYAVNAIAAVGDPALPVLKDELGNKKTRYWACLALTDFGPKAASAVPELTKLLDSGEAELQLAALLALAAVGPQAKSAVPAILKVVENEDKIKLFENDKNQLGNGFTAAFALTRIGAKGHDRELQAAIAKSSSPITRMLCAFALSKNHPENQQLIAATNHHVAAALRDKDPQENTVAARFVAQLENPPASMVPGLIAALGTLDEPGVEAVTSALVSIGAPAVPELAKALTSPKTQLAAAGVLRRIGSKASGAVPSLIQSLSSNDPQFKSEVQFALASMGPAAASAVGALRKSLAQDDLDVKLSATYALGNIGSAARDATPSLLAQLKSTNPQVGTTTAWALMRIHAGSPPIMFAATPLLTVALKADQEMVRLGAVTALGDLGSGARQSLSALRDLAANDRSSLVRAAAAEAVRKIQGQ
ncbi:MAG: HEAT repeat domain-containing protein, partial [Planctomycetales bacterium]